MEGKEKQLTVKEFEKALGASLSPYVAEKIKSYDFRYKELSAEERDRWFLLIIKTLLAPVITRAGGNRLNQWEIGWKENLDEFINSGDLESLTPRYFGKYKVIRWRQRFINPISKDFERNTLSAIQDWLFDVYFRDVKAIYEFGCGAGLNLLLARAVNKNAKLYGLDWTASSQEIIREMVKKGVLENAQGHRFDFVDPDYNMVLDHKSAVYTVAALEQVGTRFEPFIDYLIKNKPEICIHIEPIAEVLDEENLFDYLSIEYFKKRNYLSGFLDYLQKLEQDDRIKIHRAQRTNIGSLFIEGYSVIVWSPIYK